MYFLTLCTGNRQSYFLDGRVAAFVEEEIECRRMKGEIKLFCYCIMPDHLHMLLSLGDLYKKRLQDWVSAFKRYTTKVIHDRYNIKPLWQRNFYDHIIRRDESLLKIAQYILNNPVRKGMVSNWENYPYSKMVDPLPI